MRLRAEQRQLVVGRRWSHPVRAPWSGHDLFRFQELQQLLGSAEHFRREPGEPADLDPVRPVRATGLKPVQEKDLIPDLTYLNIIVANCD
jgi:hypothetical protein